IRPGHFAQRNARVRAMVRYRATPSLASASLSDGALALAFDEPLRAVTPGQLVALFDTSGVEVLGAATIRSAV
ncbi:MAG: tRNA 2-thiouridine(34) synthase MnmA, partial [Candidatus Eremiobacteraeota bacterium]|nr:tRNA 2-thiouridine(34) synthase MnmA [Candidatus Eremiobacteraeota bacterium]